MILRTAIDRSRQWEITGKLSYTLLLADFGILAWLLSCLHLFQAEEGPSGFRFWIIAGVPAITGWLSKSHRLAGSSEVVVRCLVNGLLALGAFWGWQQLHWLERPLAQLAWLAGGFGVGGVVVRLIHFRLLQKYPEQGLEIIRWFFLATVGVLLFLPYYNNRGLGAGDSLWYNYMLADFIKQLRQGIFPVWIGQTEYAFNGGIWPLRFAPLFQHWGGLIDFVTFRSLEFTAIKNAVVVTVGLTGIFSAYACFRAVLPRRPGIACVLAAFYLSSPGILAPLYTCDMYMTFMTVPFLPVAFYSLWRLYDKNDLIASTLLAASLAGLWLGHAPIALVTMTVAALIYFAKLILLPRSKQDLRQFFWMAFLFVVFGGEPFVSIATLSNMSNAPLSPMTAAIMMANAFPANFKPLGEGTTGLTDIQAGYATLVLFCLSGGLLLFKRSKRSLVFFAAGLLLACYIVPFFGKGELIYLWSHVPVWAVTILNVWPMQRIFAIWVIVMLFSVAINVEGCLDKLNKNNWFPVIFYALAVVLGVWTMKESVKFYRHGKATGQTLEVTRTRMEPYNMILTTSSYGGYERSPSYYSHGYVDPYLENRLLNKEDYSVRVDNAKGILQGRVNLLAETSTEGYVPVIAVNLRQSHFYEFSVHPHLDVDKRYVIDFKYHISPEPGFMQISGSRVFREYYLPDSGGGLPQKGPSHAFGTGPDNATTVSLQTSDPQGADVTFVYNTSRPYQQSIDFAAAKMVAYTLSELPVAVTALSPYRALVKLDRAAFLETPRVWVQGYYARVNGKRVKTERSPNNLEMIPLESGVNEVKLDYEPAIFFCHHLLVFAGGMVFTAAEWGVRFGCGNK